MSKNDDDLLETVARAMMAVSRPNADPDGLTPAPRGIAGSVPKWRLFEHLARAAIKAIEEHRVQTDDELPGLAMGPPLIGTKCYWPDVGEYTYGEHRVEKEGK